METAHNDLAMMQPAEHSGPSLHLLTQALTPKSISYPAAAHLHLINDQELNVLRRLANPVQAGIALTAAGIAVPSIPGALPAFHALEIQSAMPWDAALWLVILSISTITAVLCGINGWRCRTDADELIHQIRSRKTFPLADDAS